MSQHYANSSKGRKILFGYDAPTGGFFYTEFLRDDEIESEENDVASQSDGLTLTNLLEYLKILGVVPETNLLVADYLTADYPTLLQISIGKMFGKNIEKLLQECARDISDKYLFK